MELRWRQEQKKRQKKTVKSKKSTKSSNVNVKQNPKRKRLLAGELQIGKWQLSGLSRGQKQTKKK